MSSLNLDLSQNNLDRPLADQLRPEELKDIVGQDHLLNPQGPLPQMLKQQHLPSLILWGPPGCGKTTLAKVLAKKCNYLFEIVSAVTSGVADLRPIFAQAKKNHQKGLRTVLLVDEIHRFNRAQQDMFLPYIEDGTIILLGATTENPSFELNGALLSRCKVIVLNRLQHHDLENLIDRAEKHTQKSLNLTPDARQTLCALADGDGRYLLNLCEELFSLTPEKPLETEDLLLHLNKRRPLYDKSQDGHYNLISALHKSLRGSDVQAALYWLARMLAGGEDPMYILRRLVRFASEDIGLADPQALQQTIAAKESYHFLGSPEGELALAQATIYLATAPKSNATYTAFNQSMASAKKSGSLMPPKHILNAPTKLMKQEGYGKNYKYDHNDADGFSGQNYFPEDLKRQDFYQPVERGFEREIIKRLKYWEKLREIKE